MQLKQTKVGWQLHHGGQLTRALDQVQSPAQFDADHYFDKFRTNQILWRRSHALHFAAVFFFVEPKAEGYLASSALVNIELF